MRCSNLNKGFFGLALLASVAIAFGQGGGQGRRGGRNNNSELGLAMRKDVQKDLAVTSDEATKLTELSDKLRAERQAARGNGGGGFGGGAPDPAAIERAKQQREEQHKQLATILTAEQMVRLHEISIQLRGNRALLDEDVQKGLGLSTDQISKITELNTKMRDANRQVQEKIRNQELTREDGRTAMDNNNKIMDGELAKILTGDQATKLKAMGGKPFVADPPADGGN